MVKLFIAAAAVAAAATAAAAAAAAAFTAFPIVFIVDDNNNNNKYDNDDDNDDGSILQTGTHHIAYFLVHSRANSLYFSRSVLYILAISGTNGSSGFGSQSREQIDNKTFDIVSAGDH